MRVRAFALLFALAPLSPVARGQELTVGDEPVCVRGHVGPVDSLLVGLPGALSLEYALSDVRLAAVRRGRFALREGAVLRPLGSPELARDGPTFSLADGSALAAFFDEARTVDFVHPAYAQRPELAAVSRLEVRLVYELRTVGGETVAKVEESVRAVPSPVGSAFLRRFRFEPRGGRAKLALDVLAGGRFERYGILASGPPSEHDGSLEVPGRSLSAVYARDDGGLQVVVWSRPDGVRLEDGRLHVDLGESTHVEVATVFAPEWSREHERAFLDGLRLAR